MYFWDAGNAAAYNNRMGRYKTLRESDFVHSFASPAPKRILEIGGGSGRIAIPLHDQGHDITVIDMNSEAIRLLNERRPNIVTHVSDFESLNLGQAAPFDVVLAIEVLLYVKDWPGFFAKVRSLLSDDGVFVFTATNWWSWRSFLQRAKVALTRGEDYGFTIYGTARYRRLIREAGFRIDTVDGFLWCPCKLDSNSVLVDVCAATEKTLHLNRFTAQSPWLLYAVRKQLPA